MHTGIIHWIGTGGPERDRLGCLFFACWLEAYFQSRKPRRRADTPTERAAMLIAITNVLEAIVNELPQDTHQ